MVIKASGTDYAEVTDKDVLGVFLFTGSVCKGI